MDPTVKGVFFLIAVVLFVIAAVAGQIAPTASTKLNLVAAGLACFAFPFMWDAFSAA